MKVQLLFLTFFAHTPVSCVSFLRVTFQVSHWTSNIIMYKVVHLNLKLFDGLYFISHFSSSDVYIMNCYINLQFYFFQMELFSVIIYFDFRVKGDEFPHFSSEKVSAKFGHNITLSYLYYLKQGRPSFAVNMFIIDQLRLHKKISRKM